MTSKTPKPYKESDDHVPNPLYQSGDVDTTGTTGEVSSIDSISPVFRQARADALGNAVDVLDNDPEAAHNLVVLPESDLTRDDAEERLRAKAKEADKDPQLATGRSQAELDAQETGDKGDEAGANNSATASTTAKKAAARKTTAHKPSAAHQQKTGEAK